MESVLWGVPVSQQRIHAIGQVSNPAVAIHEGDLDKISVEQIMDASPTRHFAY